MNDADTRSRALAVRDGEIAGQVAFRCWIGDIWQGSSPPSDESTTIRQYGRAILAYCLTMHLYCRVMAEPTRLFPYKPPAAVEPSSEERIPDAALTSFSTHGIAPTSLRMLAET